MTPNLEQLRKKDVARAGSFWHEQIVPEQRDLIRTLMKTCAQESATSTFLSDVQSLSGLRWKNVWNLDVKLDHDSSFVVGLSVNDRVQAPISFGYALPSPRVRNEDTTAYLLLDGMVGHIWGEDGEPVLIPYDINNDWTRLDYLPYLYHVTCPDLRANIIVSARGWLISGVDFFNSGSGFLFQEDPVTLFPDGILHVHHGWVLSKTVFPYTLSVDPMDATGSSITRYIRSTGGIRDLESALNEVVGLAGFHVAGLVEQAIAAEEGVIYTVSGERVLIHQDHAPIAPGTYVHKGLVPGQAITIYSRCTHGDTWVNFFHIPVSGIPAKGILPYANELDRIPAGSVSVTESSGKVTLHLGVNDLCQGVFNRWVQAWAEEDPTFNDHVLANLDTENRFPFLDFLLSNVWADNGMCIVCNIRRLSAEDIGRVEDFLYRNKPVNAVSFTLTIEE